MPETTQNTSADIPDGFADATIEVQRSTRWLRRAAYAVVVLFSGAVAASAAGARAIHDHSMSRSAEWLFTLVVFAVLLGVGHWMIRASLSLRDRYVYLPWPNGYEQGRMTEVPDGYSDDEGVYAE